MLIHVFGVLSEMLAKVPNVGGLSLGVFIGTVLGFGLLKAGGGLKAALAVVGAALGGAPVLFLGDTQAKWLYPLGLVCGLSMLRMAQARVSIIRQASRPTKAGRVESIFAYIDIIVIAVATVAAVLFTVLWA